MTADQEALKSMFREALTLQCHLWDVMGRIESEAGDTLDCLRDSLEGYGATVSNPETDITEQMLAELLNDAVSHEIEESDYQAQIKAAAESSRRFGNAGAA